MTDSNTPPHEILGVDPDATEEEIKHAFREESKRHHPDHSEDPNAQQIFIELKNARNELLERCQSGQRQSADSTTQSSEPEPSPREQPNNQQRRRNRRRDRQRTRKQRRKNRQRRQRNQQRRQRDRQHKQRNRQWQRNRRQRQRDRTQQQDREPRHPETDDETTDLSVIRRILTSPTTIRLGLTVVLSLAILFTVGGFGVGLSGILVVSLLVSYVGFGVVATWNRTRGRFKPAGRQLLWPIIPAHLLGVGLFVLALQNGSFGAGLGYAIGGVIYAIIVWVGVLVVGGVIIEFVRWLTLLPLYLFVSIPLRGLWFIARWLNAKLLRYPLWSRLHQLGDLPTFGFMLSGLLTITVLFTSVGGGFTLGAMVEPTFPQKPWLPAFTVGPIYLGTLLNWLFGIVLLVCGVGSYIAAGWALTSVPWSDRYAHGYRIRPTPWNLLFIVPWILFVLTSFVTIGGSTSWTTVWFFAHPSLFVGAYILRRYGEEKVRYSNWL